MIRKSKKLWILVGLAALAGCETVPSKKKDDFDPQKEFRTAFTGWDRYGEARSCYLPNTEPSCPVEGADERQFVATCTEQGFRLVICGCNDHLCEQNISSNHE